MLTRGSESLFCIEYAAGAESPIRDVRPPSRMSEPSRKPIRDWPGLPRTPIALARFFCATVLAGFSGAVFTAIAADALGLSVLIAASVSGTLAAIVVALLLARHGPAA